VVKLAPGDCLQFDATALHGIETIEEGPGSYLSVMLTMREFAGFRLDSTRYHASEGEEGFAMEATRTFPKSPDKHGCASRRPRGRIHLLPDPASNRHRRRRAFRGPIDRHPALP
jgi:hypothetical protein